MDVFQRLLSASFLAATAAAGAATAPEDPTPPGDAARDTVAVVHLEPNETLTDNKISGSVYFSPTTNGIELSGRLTQVPSGQHGMHIHQKGNCVDPGEHFSPDGAPHGDPKNGEHHLGDLGNIQADPANEAWVSMNKQGLSLQGENSILGKALVVHVDPDDLKSQPSGNSGGVLACGIIESDDEAEVRPESQARL